MISHNKIKIITWNARGIRSKATEFFNFINSNKIDIALITETGLKSNLKFYNDNYNCYRLDREHSRGGGVAIVINKKLKVTQMSTSNCKAIETIGVEITNNIDEPIKIICAYFPGGSSNKYTKNLLRTDILKLTRLRGNYIIGGDLNCRHRAWGCIRANCWGNILHELNSNYPFTVLYSSDPTYIPSCSKLNPSVLDIFLTNCPEFFSQPTVINDLSSDHLPVTLSLNKDARLQDQNRHNLKVTNWLLFRKLIKQKLPKLAQLSLSSVKSHSQIDDMVSTFTNIIKDCILASTSCIPKHTNNQKLPQRILDTITQRNIVRRSWIRYRLPTFKHDLAQLNNQIKFLITQHRNKKWCKLLQGLEICSKPFWRVAKIIKKKRNPIPPLKLQDSSFIINKEKAELLSKQFASNFNITANLSDSETKRIVESSLSQLKNLQSCNEPDMYVRPKHIINILKRSRNNKASGFDGITNLALKLLPNSGFVFLTFIINSCLHLQYFPEVWKIAKVIPILKPGKAADDPSSY